MRADELPTPALLLDLDVVEANLRVMAERWPGTSLRPHVKLFKSTAFAAWLADAGHLAFCLRHDPRDRGLAAAGLGDDLLLANEVVDATRLAGAGGRRAPGHRGGRLRRDGRRRCRRWRARRC